jgi:hypothetical protein
MYDNDDTRDDHQTDGFLNLNHDEQPPIVSLTKEQIMMRLLDPQRTKLLTLAINEDTNKVFPLHFQAQNREEIEIDINEALHTLCSKWLFRVIDLAYDDTLD